jgi:type II secretory pathway pseudopilin PulG
MPPYTPAYGGVPPQQPFGNAAPRTNGKAIASLVCGLIGFFGVASLAAIILGHISRGEIKRSAGQLKGSGMALAGLILGYMGVIAIPILIIAAIAIPNLLHAKIDANETAAVASLRTINAAQATYSTTNPEKGVACTMADLGQANLIDSALAGGVKGGYHFTISDCSQSLNISEARAAGYSTDQILGYLDKSGQFGVQAALSEGYSEQDVIDYLEEAQRNGKEFTGPAIKYKVFAYPAEPGQSGQRAFCSDQNGVVHYDLSGSVSNCTEESPVAK